MTKQAWVILVLLLLLVGAVTVYWMRGGVPTQSPQNTDTIQATFACNGGTSIITIFDNGNNTVHLVLSDGRSLTLPQAISASGARYANADESFVFWNKGNTAFITENGTTTYDGCVTGS